MMAAQCIYLSELRASLLVSGYIRVNALNNIPNDIIDLCFKWFRDEIDHWNTSEINSTSITINTENNIATGRRSTCVGSIIISKDTDCKIWKLKLIKKSSSFCFFFVIGIVSIEKKHTDFAIELFSFGYGLDVSNGKFKSYEPKPPIRVALYRNQYPKEGDIITMKYQTIRDETECRGELYYAYSDERLKKACDDIPIDNGEKYRFGLSFYSNEESVQLLQ